MKAIWMTDRGQTLIEKVYTDRCREKLESELEFVGTIASAGELVSQAEELRHVEAVFTTWGMLPLDQDQIRTYLPALKYVFYGAGSVQYFARPFLEQGVRVFSSAAANAVPVAEYAVAQIVLANKGYFQAARLYKEGRHDEGRAFSEAHPGNYGAVVGLIGAGMIGRLVIEKLKSYRLETIVFDPFLPEEKAEKLGVQKVSLETLFEESSVISNHLANNAQTVGMLNYELFSRMKKNATFINTGRGAQVVEEDLVRALQEEPGRTAVLDVTWPEPVEEGHAFYSLPNVILTPHIAGSMQDETGRMGEYQMEEFFRIRDGIKPELEVTIEMLKTMA